MEKKRKLYANTVSSVILYGAPIWSEAIGLSSCENNCKVQRTLAIRVIAGYRTISADAALLLARIVPVALQASYLRRVFLRIHDLKQIEEWNKITEKEIKEEERIQCDSGRSLLTVRTRLESARVKRSDHT